MNSRLCLGIDSPACLCSDGRTSKVSRQSRVARRYQWCLINEEKCPETQLACKWCNRRYKAALQIDGNAVSQELTALSDIGLDIPVFLLELWQVFISDLQ